jgi:ABC-2 type transport system permease protein
MSLSSLKDNQDSTPRLTNFLASSTLDERIESALEEFDRQLAGQQAFVNRFGIISPAILLHEGMATLAGNGVIRYQRFQDQVSDFHRQWKQFFAPRILEGIAITATDFTQMPS